MKRVFYISLVLFSNIFSYSCDKEVAKVEKVSLHFDVTEIDNFFKKYVADGKVKYEEAKHDNALNTYIGQIKNFEPYSIEDVNERLAFWINAYNAFTIKLVLDYYPIESILDIESQTGVSPWSINFIEMAGGRKFSLDEIEKKIIIKKYKDPRIHYVLVCAAESCPVLISKAYTIENLNELFDTQASFFLNDKSKNRINSEDKTIELSTIYKWYKSDFTDKDSTVINHIKKYINETDKDFISKNNVEEINYLDYSWKLNEYKKTE